MQSILRCDRSVLHHINAQWHNTFLDGLLPALRNPNTWLPLYLFLLLFVAINYKNVWWQWLLLAIATVVVCNYISSNILKEHIVRLRPCNDPVVAGWIRTFKGIYLPQSSGFVSSHATNHFGMAMFFFVTLSKQFKVWPWLFFVWAFFIAYAQLYIGVHYPTDVLGGTIIGLIAGYTAGRIFNTKWGLC